MLSNVEEITELVKKVILERITPLSIMLIGSFGRDEGSVLIKEATKRLLRDMDILIVVRRRIASSKILEINKVINDRIGSSYSHESNLYRQFVVTVFQIPLQELQFWNDIKPYDIKFASKLIWGIDTRGKISINHPCELSPFSAFRPLLNKYIGLSLFSPLNRGDKTENVGPNAILEFAKTYVEMGTSACILDGKYVPSYEKRMPIVDHEIGWISQQLKKKIVKFTEMKLKPSLHKEIFSRNPIDMWFETRDDLNRFFLKITEKVYNLQLESDWVTFMDSWIQKMRKEALLPTFNFYVKKRWGISSNYLSHLLNFFYEFSFSYRVARESGLRGVKNFVSPTNPLFEVYGLGILLTNSVNRDFSLNRSYIRAILKRQEHLSFTKFCPKYKIPVEEVNDTDLFLQNTRLLSQSWGAVQKAFYGA